MSAVRVHRIALPTVSSMVIDAACSRAASVAPKSGEVDRAGVQPSVPQVDRHRDGFWSKGPRAESDGEVARIAVTTLGKAFFETRAIKIGERRGLVDRAVAFGAHVQDHAPQPLRRGPFGDPFLEDRGVGIRGIDHSGDVGVQPCPDRRVVQVVLARNQRDGAHQPRVGQRQGEGRSLGKADGAWVFQPLRGDQLADVARPARKRLLRVRVGCAEAGAVDREQPDPGVGQNVGVQTERAAHPCAGAEQHGRAVARPPFAPRQTAAV